MEKVNNEVTPEYTVDGVSDEALTLEFINLNNDVIDVRPQAVAYGSWAGCILGQHTWQYNSTWNVRRCAVCGRREIYTSRGWVKY